MWMDPAEDDQNRDWARGFAQSMKPYEVGTPYPNFIAADEGSARLRSSYGPEKYERLVALKRQWDPDNLFRLNQNIDPALAGPHIYNRQPGACGGIGRRARLRALWPL